MKWFTKIRVGFLHAAYHRNLRKAIKARDQSDIQAFKKYIYRAEDAWKQIVRLREK